MWCAQVEAWGNGTGRIHFSNRIDRAKRKKKKEVGRWRKMERPGSEIELDHHGRMSTHAVAVVAAACVAGSSLDFVRFPRVLFVLRCGWTSPATRPFFLLLISLDMARHQRLSLEAADFLSFLSFFVVLLLTAVFKCISRFFPFEPNVSDGCQMLIERLHRKLRRQNDSVDRIEQPS